ncbi:MAG: hypothetical protein QOE15_1855 [Acidimicrobiaceae bacterium]|jgi:hypothetical protein|nr:hypothetical protein [Acidimicrobiaceae bacterium]
MIWLIAGGIFVILLILAAAGWRDLMSARSRLVSAKGTLDQIVTHPAVLNTGEGRSVTTQQLTFAVDEVTVARHIIGGSFPLKLARLIPVVSSQRSGLLRLVDDSATALTAGHNLVVEADRLVAEGKVNGAQVPIGSLATFETDLRKAGATISGLRRSSGGLLGPVGRARRQFNTLATDTGSRLLNDADAVGVGQSLLGSGGARRYFIALENDAEMRNHGAILSYALVSIDKGHVAVTDHGPILTPIQVPGKGVSTPLLLKSPAPTAIPPGTATVFGGLFPTQSWTSVNATADFPFSAKAMQDMYHQATGQSVDGVIALDVPALSSLLSVVGPVSVPDINEQITAQNAGTVILHDLYDSFPVSQQVVRKELLSEVVTEVVNRLSAGSFDPLPLAQQLANAAAGGHMRVWSGVGQEEGTLERVGLGGGPATNLADRTFHLAVENRNATKVDYYVKTALQQQVTITGAGTAIIRTTVTVHNGAPPGAKPSYQLGPDGYSTTQPGEYWAWVLLWGPKGSDQSRSVLESGLQLSNTDLDRIYAGETRQVVFNTVIQHAVRDGKLELRYVPQPRLTPPALSVTIQAPGWTVGGKATYAGSWDRTITLSWDLHH